MKEKTMQQIWIGSGLRMARHVALSTLLLSGVNHAALAQTLPTAQTIPLANAQFDKSLLRPVQAGENKELYRPNKNKPLTIGYILSLEKVRIEKTQKDFRTGKITLQEMMRRQEAIDLEIKGALDELDIRNFGSVTKDNSAKGRAKRREYTRKQARMSIPERVFNWAAESLRSFIGGDEKKG